MGGVPPAGYHGQQNLSNTGSPSDLRNFPMQLSQQQVGRQPVEVQSQSANAQPDEPVESWEEMADSPPQDYQWKDKEPPADSWEGKADQMSQESEQPQVAVPVDEVEMDVAVKEDNGAELREEPLATAVKPVESKQPKTGRSEQREKKDTTRLQQAESTKLKVAPQLPTTDDKENLNIIFIGHVDAGKSTIGGQLMYVVHTRCGLYLRVVLFYSRRVVLLHRFLTGQVDKRTLEKFEREARAKNRETWYLSWALDLNPEEREKVW